jgi:hypothetical protein
MFSIKVYSLTFVFVHRDSHRGGREGLSTKSSAAGVIDVDHGLEMPALMDGFNRVKEAIVKARVKVDR